MDKRTQTPNSAQTHSSKQRDADTSAADLKELDARLNRLRHSSVVRNPHTGPVKRTAGADAARYAVEFVAAVGIGFGMGWALDSWLGTRPWLMVLVGVLGFVAGVVNVYRAAEGMSRSSASKSPTDSGGTDT